LCPRLNEGGEPLIYYFGNNRVEASLLKGYTGGSSGRAWVAV
jgi:hypothetical protein